MNASLPVPPYTVEEVAQRLGLHRTTVCNHAKDGTIPSVRIGRRILFPRARFERWLEGKETEGLQSPALRH